MNTITSDNMKRLIYILAVIVFFNLSVICLYYLRVINSYGISFFNAWQDIFINNIIVFILSLIYSFLYSKYLIKKFNYFKCLVLGLLIGILISFINPNSIFEERLFVILFTGSITNCHLTDRFLHAVFYFSRIFCSLLVPIWRTSRAAHSSQD